MKTKILAALYKITCQIKTSELTAEDISEIKDYLKDANYELDKKMPPAKQTCRTYLRN